MGDLVDLANSKRDAMWWTTYRVVVEWSARREADAPVIEASGRILLWGEDDDEEPTIEAGTIRVVKPILWAGLDPRVVMDDLSGDCAVLADAVLDAYSYDDAFSDWFVDEFGVMPQGDPIFIEDVDVRGRYREARDSVVAQAVLEASATFGSASAPIIGFGYETVRAEIRQACRERGMWDWERPLGAKPWKAIIAAARPQE